MMAKCDYCKLFKRVNKITGVCSKCRNEMIRVADKYFDGDPFLPLKSALVEMGIPIPEDKQ